MYVRLSTKTRSTYQDGGIVGHTRLRMVVLFLVIGNLDVLDISPSKDDIIEFLARWRDEVLGLATLGAEGIHIFKGDGRLLLVDVVEPAGVTDIVIGDEVEKLA